MLRTCWLVAVSVAALVVGFVGQSKAAVITNLYNTGVDSSSTVLSNGTVGDPHYTLDFVGSGSMPLSTLSSAGGYPVGPWLGDDTSSSWIGPGYGASAAAPAGAYIYRTTFDLTGFAPTTALITGQWAASGLGLSIELNGNGFNHANVLANSTSWNLFTIASGFVSGVNTLDFIVLNFSPGPTGLRVEMQGTTLNDVGGGAIPEPCTLAVWSVLGAVGMAGGWLRRRKTS